jgi:cytochrome c
MKSRKHFTAALLLGLSTAGAHADPQAMAQKARCDICHDVEQQRMGPSWTAIAARYKEDAEALESLRTKVRHGSSGVWGPAPMPPVPETQLSDTDLNRVLAWILER